MTPALRRGRPIWLRHVRRAIRTYPSLSGRHETTVAIVGGGITGALIAQAFASSGIATVVLEAAAVGRGSTAASSALLLQETDLELAQLTERYGSRASRRIWRLGQESVAALVALLTRLKIRCDLAHFVTRQLSRADVRFGPTATLSSIRIARASACFAPP